MHRENRYSDAPSHWTDAYAQPSSYDRLTQPSDRETQSVAESLFRIGRLTKYLVRHGADPRDTAGELGVDPTFSSIALAFTEAPDVLKLCAIVEDWSLAEITRRLAGRPA